MVFVFQQLFENHCKSKFCAESSRASLKNKIFVALLAGQQPSMLSIILGPQSMHVASAVKG